MRYGMLVLCMGLLACGGGVEPASQGRSSVDGGSTAAVAEGEASGSGPSSGSAEPTGRATDGTSTTQTSSRLEYDPRDFESVGTGRLVVDGREYPFAIAECHLEDRELSSGATQDVYVLGAGEVESGPFFLEVKRSRLEKKNLETAGITLHFAPLPALYAHEMAVTHEVGSMLEQIQQVDSLRSMGFGAVAYDDLVVDGSSVTTREPFALMSVPQGGLGGRGGEGALTLDCSG